MTDDLIPFKSLAQMRDAVLNAQPTPEAIRLASPSETMEHEMLLRAVVGMRQGCAFVFNDFDLNTEFCEKTEQGERAFITGSLAMPHPRFTALTKLISNGEPAMAIVMAEELSPALHGFPTDHPLLCVYAVEPLRWPDKSVVEFHRISPAMLMTSGKDFVYRKPVWPPIDERETAMLDVPLALLLVMLTVLADDGTVIRRTVAPAKVNELRTRRGLPPIRTHVDRQRQRPRRALHDLNRAEAAAAARRAAANTVCRSCMMAAISGSSHWNDLPGSGDGTGELARHLRRDRAG